MKKIEDTLPTLVDALLRRIDTALTWWSLSSDERDTLTDAANSLERMLCIAAHVHTVNGKDKLNGKARHS